MTQTNPPFYADQVGSLLRPPPVRDARAKLVKGEIAAPALAAIEDKEIERLVGRQESLGLKAVTDGELRRGSFLHDFFEKFDGIATHVEETKTEKLTTYVKRFRVVSKIGFPSTHPQLDHFKFLKQRVKATPKMTLPTPGMLISAQRDWRSVVLPETYAEIGAFYRDLGLACRAATHALAAAGCRYLQLDDCNFAYMCDPSWVAKVVERGDDPKALVQAWIDMINSAIADRPKDMTVTLHICRGNMRSHWFAQGGYEPIAEALFNKLNVDAYFLEYDNERSGGFEPLRFLPKSGSKAIVLGLITTKTGALENRESIKRRIDEAAKIVDLGRLRLSPQCGFASVEGGNDLSEDEQWRKLESVVSIASEVWGRA